MYNFQQHAAHYLARKRVSVTLLRLLAMLCLAFIVLYSDDVASTLPLTALALLFSCTLISMAARVSAIQTGHPLTHTTLLTPGYFSCCGLYFSVLGLGLYRLTGTPLYIYAVLGTALLWLYLVIILFRHPVDRYTTSHAQPGSWLLQLVDRFSDPQILPWLVLLLSLLKMEALLFWAGLFAVISAIRRVLNLLKTHDSEATRELARGALNYLFYMTGAFILLVLVMQMPFADLVQAMDVVGPEDIWLLLVPAVWVIPYAMTLQVLLDYRISFIDALYTQISGDAFNSITPFLGFGGEPWKARHLARFVPVDDASHAIIQSRIIHAISGVLFTALILGMTVWLVDLSAHPGYAYGMGVVAVLMLLIFGLLLWVSMSKVPSHITRFLLARLKLLDEFRHFQPGWKKVGAAIALKMAGRIGKFLELFLIFYVLDIDPELVDIILVEAMVMLSVSLFFFVPQGLGVNEAGILAAFSIAGLAAASGIAFGLLRRARMLAYTLIGLLVYLLGTVTRFGSKRYDTTRQSAR